MKYAKLIKALTIILCSLIVIFLLFYFFGPLLFSIALKFYGYFMAWFANPAFWLNLSIFMMIVVAFILTVVFVLPISVYLIKKIYAYISLLFICIIRGYQIKINRIPFRSLKGMSSQGDITITTKESKMQIHFLDLVFPFKRAVTLLDGDKYVITPVHGKSVSKFTVVRGEVQKYGHSGNEGRGHKFGVLISSGHVLAKNKDKVKEFPNVNHENIINILLLSSNPVELNIRQNGNMLSISESHKIGNFTYYSLKHFKKELKKKTF